MSSIGTGYDLSSTTFSPDGKVFQVDYATKAVDNSGTAIGLKCKDGVVLGVQKLVVSKMLVEGSNRRIHTVDKHAGIAYAGLCPDGRQIINRARAEASQYKNFYGDAIPGQTMCDRIANYVHLFTLYWYVRPYGVGTLLAMYDKEGPQLYQIEPSGIAYSYYGTAVGKGRQAAKTEIERLNLKEMTCREAVLQVAKLIYQVHDEAKDKAFELELSWVCTESKMQHEKVPADLHASATAYAKEALEEDMDD
jgi:20S proteasome subunit alpha 7